MSGNLKTLALRNVILAVCNTTIILEFVFQTPGMNAIEKHKDRTDHKPNTDVEMRYSAITLLRF